MSRYLNQLKFIAVVVVSVVVMVFFLFSGAEVAEAAEVPENAEAAKVNKTSDNVLKLPQATYSGKVLDTQGRPLAGASVLVFKTGTKTKAKLFSMNFAVRKGDTREYDVKTRIEVPNPVIADQGGRFRFMIAGGDYDLHIKGRSTAYSLTDVTIMNPFTPHAITIKSPSEIPLTLVERAEKTHKGNVAMLMNRPGSADANNWPAPYRIIVNKGENGWALTFNADWDGINKTWTRRDLPMRSTFFRINGETHALEYGNDYRSRISAPVMETLFRISAEGEFWMKSHQGGVGPAMILHNNVMVNGKRRLLHQGDVVVLDTDNPYSVIAPRKYADHHPMTVLYMDPDDTSLVHVIFGGGARVNTPYEHSDFGKIINTGDRLVTEGANSFRAILAVKGVDPRAYLGRISSFNFISVP